MRRQEKTAIRGGGVKGGGRTWRDWDRRHDWHGYWYERRDYRDYY